MITTMLLAALTALSIQQPDTLTPPRREEKARTAPDEIGPQRHAGTAESVSMVHMAAAP